MHIQKYDLTVPEKFRRIGIRMEDNILATDGADCPMVVADIEHALSCR